MKRGILKLFSLVLTVSVVVILVMSGPAKAFLLSIEVSSQEVLQGTPVSFVVKGEIENPEVINPEYFQLEIIGIRNYSCNFDQAGKVIKGCKGMTIQKLSDPIYGYGYGFVSGEFTYNITMQTDNLKSGNYKTRFKIVTKEREYDTISQFKINYPNLQGCSIRAKDGILNINGSLNLTKNKLNFYIPLKKAAPGEGYLTSQLGRKTFYYKFKVDKVIEDNETLARIFVTGQSRFDLQKKKTESAVIYLDTLNNHISISGESFDVESINITFKENC